MNKIPLNDEVVVAILQPVDDALTPKRKPSHADLLSTNTSFPT